MSTIGSRIREAREAKGWTQEELATKLGIAQAFVSQIENGRRRPTPALTQRIVENLGIPQADLLAEKAEAGEKLAIIHRKLEGLSSDSLSKIETFVAFVKDSEKRK